MKQYTTPEQTAKLIEMGFEKPRNERWVLDVANESTPSIQNIVKRQDYSIGELIEMLPMDINNDGRFESLLIHLNYHRWVVKYLGFFIEPTYQSCREELIDALYNMIIELKGEGMI